jgi:hypothetical protein
MRFTCIIWAGVHPLGSAAVESAGIKRKRASGRIMAASREVGMEVKLFEIEEMSKPLANGE